MKTIIMTEILLIGILILPFNGCKKDSNNPINQSNFIAKGTDYLPISSGRILNAKVTGTSTEYDSLGYAVKISQINNQTYSGSIGESTMIGDMNVNPLYINNDNKSLLLGYMTIINGDIIGFNDPPNTRNVTLLPSELTVGKEWILNYQNSPYQQIKVKVIEALNDYTNSVGNSFTNVINLHVTYADSVRVSSIFEKTILDCNIYSAKGIGIIGATLNNYETVTEWDYPWKYYQRTKVNGTIGFTN